MSDLWAVSIPAAVGLGGVIFTQVRADSRADRREREAAKREAERDKIGRQREVKDRWFEDRKAAYVAALVAARDSLDYLAAMKDIAEIVGPELVKTMDSHYEKTRRLTECAGDLELVGSTEALNNLAGFVSHIRAASPHSDPGDLAGTYSYATALFVKFREAARADLAVDGGTDV